MHLQIAEQILASLEQTPVKDGRLHTDLTQNLPAFYLGNIAPDFQIVCHLPREETHFFPIPPALDADAFATMLAKYPALQQVTVLSHEQAVFIAAYGAHLLLDLIWFNEILIPYFVKSKDLGDRKRRTLLHFSVLTYLDRLAQASLPHYAGKTLSAAKPHRWLPFGDGDALLQWRHLVAKQLAPGAATETVEIFAGRLNMPPEAFAANLDDTHWLETNIFRVIPVDTMQAILQTAVPRTIQLLTNYLYPAE